ncbi:hypothetical protein M5K25_018409 [Dendrobium thyrsiflorum]|uniref:Uncharacterized protein n=1 Tax=Dendrobium thyrsiflorum TaxID=117978 RepID=A0ABD0UIL9_DENTH
MSVQEVSTRLRIGQVNHAKSQARAHIRYPGKIEEPEVARCWSTAVPHGSRRYTRNEGANHGRNNKGRRYAWFRTHGSVSLSRGLENTLEAVRE